MDRLSTSIFGGTAGLAPDPLNYGWRDYGIRVGIWRLIKSLDRHGVPASVLLNSDVCSRYPQTSRPDRSAAGLGSLTAGTTPPFRPA